MRSRLDQIEEQLQRFIESSVQLFPSSNRQPLLARRLVAALQESLTEDENGREAVPGAYIIYLHPETLAKWKPRQEVFDALAQVLLEAAHEAGVRFLSSPAIRLTSDASLPLEEFRIMASHHTDHLGRTDVLQAGGDGQQPGRNPRPINAYLILDGSKTFPLRRAVITIGRRMDNHLVIDDPRVSRTHAQIRAIRGRYVLFDLNSTGGTYVNSQRITQHSLKPGDVISLAGYTLIYGEDTPSADGSSTASWPAQPL